MKDELFSVSTNYSRKSNIPKRNTKIGNKKYAPKGNLFDSNDKNKHQDILLDKRYIGVIIVLVIIAILGIAAYFIFFNKPKNNKEKVLGVFKTANILEIFNIKREERFLENLNKKSFEYSGKAKIDDTNLWKYLKEKTGKANILDTKENKEKKNVTIKDMKISFNGKRDNVNKSSKSHVDLKYEDTLITNWETYENKDLHFIRAKDFFKEDIGYLKEKGGLYKNVSKKSVLQKNVDSFLNSGEGNFIKEFQILRDDMKKTFLRVLDEIPENMYEVERNVKTLLDEKNIRVSNFSVKFDKIALDKLFRNIKEDVNLRFGIDANKFTSINKEKFLNSLERYKPVLQYDEVLKVTIYGIKKNVYQVKIEIEKENSPVKVLAEIYISSDKQDNATLIIQMGESKFKLVKDEQHGNIEYLVELQIEKNKLNLFFNNEIDIQDASKKNNENKKDNTKKEQKKDDTKINITDNILSKNNVVINGENNKFLVGENVSNIKIENTTSEIKGKQTEKKEIDEKQKNDILKKEKNENIFELKAKFTFPKNVDSSNLDISLDVYSNIISFITDFNLKFVENLNIDIDTNNIFYIDKLKEEERKNLVNNVIIKEILKVTAKKIDEIEIIKNKVVNR